MVTDTVIKDIPPISGATGLTNIKVYDSPAPDVMIDAINSMGAYTRLLRPLLFKLDAEAVHDAAMTLTGGVGAFGPARGFFTFCCRKKHPALRMKAAGFDKTGQAVRGLAALGFGSVEIGSISALPTAGNPKPRLWRLPADRAIMVWYGIPNPGAARVADNLKWVDMPVSLGININSTNHGQCAPALGRDEILADYLRSAKVLAPFGDYMVLTLSCPNTSEPDLFAKTGNLSLSLRLIEESGVKLPIFIKPAPDGGVAAMEPMLMEVESSSLAAGFIYNLSPQKPG